MISQLYDTKAGLYYLILIRLSSSDVRPNDMCRLIHIFKLYISLFIFAMLPVLCSFNTFLH
jgi:hypothetical protein